jgi:trehalose-6-phosphate synthase
VRKDVLEGVLAADLVGFHTYDYARHFLSACTRILGVEYSPKGVEYHGMFCNVGAYPIGIDPEQVRVGEVNAVKVGGGYDAAL